MYAVNLLVDRIDDVEREMSSATQKLNYWQGQQSKLSAEREEMITELDKIRGLDDA